MHHQYLLEEAADDVAVLCEDVHGGFGTALYRAANLERYEVAPSAENALGRYLEEHRGWRRPAQCVDPVTLIYCKSLGLKQRWDAGHPLQETAIMRRVWQFARPHSRCSCCVARLFPAGSEFHGDICIPSLNESYEGGEGRHPYELRVLGEWVGNDYLKRVVRPRHVLRGRHRAYDDEQGVEIVISVAEGAEVDVASGAGLTITFADYETCCTGRCNAASQLEGVVAQLERGEHGFYHAAEEITHTFSLERSSAETPREALARFARDDALARALSALGEELLGVLRATRPGERFEGTTVLAVLTLAIVGSTANAPEPWSALAATLGFHRQLREGKLLTPHFGEELRLTTTPDELTSATLRAVIESWAACAAKGLLTLRYDAGLPSAMLMLEDWCAQLRREARVASEATFRDEAGRVALLAKLTTRAEVHRVCGEYQGHVQANASLAFLARDLTALNVACARTTTTRGDLQQAIFTARVRVDNNYRRWDEARRGAETRLPTEWYLRWLDDTGRREEEEDEGAPEECVICMTEYTAGEGGGETLRLPCPGAHSFHLACATPWLHSHTTCPLCRFELAPREN